MTKAYEIVKRSRAKNNAKGLCANGCGRPLRTKTLCDICAKNSSFKANKKRNKLRLELISQGLCSNKGCGNTLATKWMCRPCADKVRQYAKNWYTKNPNYNRDNKRKHLHKYRFSGLRPAVIERDSNVCQLCFRKDKKVHVHHINENDKDNRMDNLICLCYICHIVVERINRTKPNLLHLFPWFQQPSI